MLPPVEVKYNVMLQEAVVKLEEVETDRFITEKLKESLREYHNVNLAFHKDFQLEDQAKQEQEDMGLPYDKTVVTITGDIKDFI